MSDSSPKFPLTKRSDGRWCKKIRGKLHYFTGTAEEALAEWLRVRADLEIGRPPPPRPASDGVTISDACNFFLEFKESRLESGELAPRSFHGLKKTCEFLVATFGRNRAVVSLGPPDFIDLRAKMAERWGPIKLGKEIGIVRSVFKYAYDTRIIPHPVLFGPNFRKPSEKTMRLLRAEDGPRLFEPWQIREILSVADYNLKAMVLLGINGGLGNSDLAELTTARAEVAVETGWLDYPRVKTGVERRIPLWPETALALKATLANRREARDPAEDHLLFIGSRGASFRDKQDRRVSRLFAETVAKTRVNFRTFYDLRRTFQTVAEDANDLVAVQSIMGHAAASGDMSARYRQKVSNARLLAVTECVRQWALICE